MENKYFDVETYICLDCSHRWVLGSDKTITKKQHGKWLEEAKREHKLIEGKIDE